MNKACFENSYVSLTTGARIKIALSSALMLRGNHKKSVENMNGFWTGKWVMQEM